MLMAMYDQIETVLKTRIYMDSWQMPVLFKDKMERILEYLFAAACLFEANGSEYLVVEIIHKLKSHGVILDVDMKVKNNKVSFIFKPLLSEPIKIEFNNNLTEAEVNYLWANTIHTGLY
jgi:hypothetical protein